MPRKRARSYPTFGRFLAAAEMSKVAKSVERGAAKADELFPKNTGRRCTSCGKLLSRYNDSDQCRACKP